MDEYMKAQEVKIKLDSAAYKGNIGFIELAQFYQQATKPEIAEMEKVVKRNDWGAFKTLIEKVIGKKLI